jgi:Zn finger protein HypA/HybF involved in hydrogenase expression
MQICKKCDWKPEKDRHYVTCKRCGSLLVEVD